MTTEYERGLREGVAMFKPGAYLDLASAASVEVLWDARSRRLWINTEHGNVGRIYNVGEFNFKAANTEDAGE